MKYNIYRVSFQYSETTYCSNIAKALNRQDVENYYSEYPWYHIQEATESDLSEAARKGMPVIVIA